jgi:hypothetical protein
MARIEDLNEGQAVTWTISIGDGLAHFTVTLPAVVVRLGTGGHRVKVVARQANGDALVRWVDPAALHPIASYSAAPVLAKTEKPLPKARAWSDAVSSRPSSLMEQRNRRA